MTNSQTVSIEGMTCGGCERAVRAALGALDGVQTVEANAEAGTAVLTADRPIDRSELASALEEAGFTLK